MKDRAQSVGEDYKAVRGETASTADPLIDRLYDLLNRRFRAKRMRAFEVKAKLSPDTRILDVGGTPRLWSFPDAHLDRERVLGVTKSLTAWRGFSES